jgi:hypothetical protein
MRITEPDYIALATPIGKWPAGTRGAVLIDHGSSKLIEIADHDGQTLDMLEVPEEQLKLIQKYGDQELCL